MSDVKTIYLAGPMRGYPNYNFHAFGAAHQVLEDRGYHVISPAQIELDHGEAEWVENAFDGPALKVADSFDIHQALERDFYAILAADGIVFLPGWKQSTGAVSEFFVGYRTGRALGRYDEKYLEGVCWWRDEETQRIFDELAPVQPRTGPVWHATSDNSVSLDKVETRVTDPNTGGQKGSKLAQIGALEPNSLLEVAKVAGFGATKYEQYNFLKGYAWSLSFNALQRHLLAAWAGEDYDEESGLLHLAHATWHCLTLIAFLQRDIGTDDRPPSGKGTSEDATH